MDTLPLSSAPRALGATKLRAFPLAYGCWRFAGTTVKEARTKIDAALAIGIDLFDHADIYGGDGAAEDLFGRALAEAPHLRERMILATKGGIVPGVPYDSSPEHLAAAVEGSLARLRVDTIDLWQIHRPDPLGHPEEIASALERLESQGKIRHLGVSNYTPSMFDALSEHLRLPIATHQPELSCWAIAPLRDGILDQSLRRSVTPLAWSPLAGGLLLQGAADARRGPEGARLAALIEALDGLARREGVSRSAVALAWLLVHPAGVIPIVGTQRPERLRDAAESLRVRLTRADWYAVLAASQGAPHP